MKTVKIHQPCNQCNNKNQTWKFIGIKNNTVNVSQCCPDCRTSFFTSCTFKVWNAHLQEDQMLLEITKHHRLPRSRGGSNELENISLVPWAKHQAFHLLFGTKTPEDIIDDLNNIWLPSNVKLQILKT